MEQRKEIRRQILHCKIAGFTHWDGCIAFNNLQIGSKLKMVRDTGNAYDQEAVALFLDEYKLGYIPRYLNSMISQFLDMGYQNAFEVRVSRICKEAHPESQVSINVYIKRNE